MTATTAHPASQTVSVTLTDPRTRASQALVCTPNHPFYVVGQGFTPAGSLGIGSSIVTRAGPGLCVSGLQFQSATAGDTQVYNLTVDGDHTYFVGTGNGGAWVHNTCRARPKSMFIDDGNLKGGWFHINARHIHPHGAADLFAPGTTRAQIETAAQEIVAKGTRTSENPSLYLQTFERRMNVNGMRARYSVTVEPNGRVVTAYPALGGQ